MIIDMSINMAIFYRGDLQIVSDSSYFVAVLAAAATRTFAANFHPISQFRCAKPGRICYDRARPTLFAQNG
jgi:hypothetical protein